MDDNRWVGKLIGAIGLIASLISICGFITGIFTLKQLLADPTPTTQTSGGFSTPTLDEPITPPAVITTALPTPSPSATSTSVPASSTPPPTFTELPPTLSPTSSQTPVPTLIVEKLSVEWQSVPSGQFVAGSSDTQLQQTLSECNNMQGNCEIGWFDQELPERTLNLGDFEIGSYEVSNSQYMACVHAGACKEPVQIIHEGISFNPLFFADNYPVVGVSFYDANNFCNWIGARLPTEDEWEKAARGTDGRRYPWGNEFVDGKANLATFVPAPVGTYRGGDSPYGITDMAGNVFEWTSTAVGNKYMLRGGSWHTPAFRGRTNDKGTKLEPQFVNYDVGFRCVR